MSKLDLLKFFESFDGEVSEADFTVDDLRELTGEEKPQTQQEIADEYFEYYDDVKDRTRGHEDW